jgi:hypothetical protein
MGYGTIGRMRLRITVKINSAIRELRQLNIGMKPRAVANDFLAIMRFNEHDAGVSPERDVSSISPMIDGRELRERQKSYLIDHYLGLHITVVSITLAMGGVGAASLIGRPSTSGIQILTLWLLWVGNFLATGVAYAGAMVGAFALPASVPTVTDLLLPLLMCVIEFLLFAILIHQATSIADFDTLLNTWLVLMALFAAIAELSILRAGYHFVRAAREGIYSSEALRAIVEYVGRLRRDSAGAGVTFLLATIAAALRISGFATSWSDLLFPSTLVVLLVAAMTGHAETAQMWRAYIIADHGQPAAPCASCQLDPADSAQRAPTGTAEQTATDSNP